MEKRARQLMRSRMAINSRKDNLLAAPEYSFPTQFFSCVRTRVQSSVSMTPATSAFARIFTFTGTEYNRTVCTINDNVDENEFSSGITENFSRH